jgi:hypothetical protein
MNAFITQQATSVSSPRVGRVLVDAFRDASRPRSGARHAVGTALVAIGQRVAGEMPARRPVPVESDCA